MLDTQESVASLVLKHSECAEVFRRYRIDYCCQGGQPIAQAAESKKVDLAELTRELTKAIEQRAPSSGPSPTELSTEELIGHIVSRHHDYLRRALPFVHQLAAKVHRVHGQHEPRLSAVERDVQELQDTLLAHLDDEEAEVFPSLLKEDRDPQKVEQLLHEMNEEHLALAKLLGSLRDNTDAYQPPDWACNSYRTLFSELERLEQDTFAHVHLENHVLRPRFVA